MTLTEHNEWLNSRQFKFGNAKGICQCGTEEVIKSASEPERMRAELLSYVFLDQFLYTHYRYVHYEFESKYPGPKLYAHGGYGYASPSWFIYSYHGYDKNANWKLISSTLNDYLEEGLHQLKQKIDIADNEFWSLVRNEIKSEFDVKHQEYLLAACK